MENISIVYLIQIVLKYLYLIVAAVIVFALGAFFYSNYIAVPKYSATGSLLVTNGAITVDLDNPDTTKKVAGADISASLTLKPTIVETLNENGIYKALAEKNDGQYSFGQLKGATRVNEGNTDSLYTSVTFTSSDAGEAKRLVNELLSLAPEYIKMKIPGAKTSITVADNAVQTYPNVFSNMLTAAFLGAVIALIPILLMAFLNNTIHTENDLIDNYEIPVIGNIPDFANAKSGKGYYKNNYYYQRGGYGYYGKR